MNLRRLLRNMLFLCDKKYLAEDLFSRKFIDVFWTNFAYESVRKFLVERSYLLLRMAKGYSVKFLGTSNLLTTDLVF